MLIHPRRRRVITTPHLHPSCSLTHSFGRCFLFCCVVFCLLSILAFRASVSNTSEISLMAPKKISAHVSMRTTSILLFPCKRCFLRKDAFCAREGGFLWVLFSLGDRYVLPLLAQLDAHYGFSFKCLF